MGTGFCAIWPDMAVKSVRASVFLSGWSSFCNLISTPYLHILSVVIKSQRVSFTSPSSRSDAWNKVSSSCCLRHQTPISRSGPSFFPLHFTAELVVDTLSHGSRLCPEQDLQHAVIRASSQIDAPRLPTHIARAQSPAVDGLPA